MIKIFFSFVLLALVTAELFSNDFNFTQEEKQWLEKNQPITYVGDPDWLPFEAFVDGKYIGIVADLISYLEKTTPLRFKIIETSSWKESVEMISTNRVMMISASEDFNKQTEQIFSGAYYKNPIIIVMSNKQHYVQSLYSIRDKKIAVVMKQSFYKKIKTKYPMIHFIDVKDEKDGLESVAYGKADAFINTLAQTSYAIAKLQMNDLQIVGKTEFNTQLGFGISREYPLLKSIINKALKEVSPNIANDILSKWINQKYIEKPDYTALFIALGVFAFISMMALFFYMKVAKETRAREVAQNKMLEQQSKMASMGEMLDAVAHQWKQPLNAMSMYLDLMKSDYEDGVVDKSYVNELYEGMNTQINHMTTTLSEFRNFFRPNSEVVSFNLLKLIHAVLLLTKDEFLKNQINIEVDVDKNITLEGNENEFKHLIINIINNSKDAFNERGIKNRIITIKASYEDLKVKIEIEDSAGGIPKEVIQRIFESNFTTKATGKGTGIGLYMSAQIVDKMDGKIDVKNINDGVCFYIVFQK